jgi:hypothetical protein
MSSPSDCTENFDPLILVREGTSQQQRLTPALDPAYAPVDERSVAHGMVFAQAYSAFLNYFDANNLPAGDWQPFFSKDVSVQLAVAAVQDVEYYKSQTRAFFSFLADIGATTDEAAAKQNLGFLFSCAGTLAKQLDLLKEGLPPDIALKGTLQNLIRSQLAPAFRRLLAYYKADLSILPESDRLIADQQPGLVILGSSTVPFSVTYQSGLSADWFTDNSADWSAYTTAIAADATVYGSGATALERINHIATHNLFSSIFDQLLKVYARTAGDGERALEATLTGRDDHQPHYALFLAFLRLFAYAREQANTLTGRHLDFYYREILRLQEKAPVPGKVHLLAELAKQATEHLFPAGELFKAGKDDLGKDAFFANDRDVVANQAKVASLSTVYRHGDEKVGVTAPSDIDQGRIFASPVANSQDGLGAAITSEDQSWHPFHNKIFQDGVLAKIDMPKAEIGFAVASHYLLLAQGIRTIAVSLQTSSPAGGDYHQDVVCLFTTAKGWLEKSVPFFFAETGDITLTIQLDGADPAVVPYSMKTHGYSFNTDLPIMMVKLKQRDTAKYAYPALQDLVITGFDLAVYVQQLKMLALSNDFGPVDSSKPFQPFGASPVKNSALTIGSKEVFQKKLNKAVLNVQWQNTPAPYGATQVDAVTQYLQGGVWKQYKHNVQADVTGSSFTLLGDPQSPDKPPYVDAPDLSENQYYDTSSLNGFVRLQLSGDFGQESFEQALIDYIKRVTDSDPNNDGTKPIAPTGPFITELTLDYNAQQSIALNSATPSSFDNRGALFYHLAPFGYAEQHPFLKAASAVADQSIYLLPQLKHLNVNDPNLPAGQPVKHEAEFYIGISDLQPPQNLALLFQVADGTADPLSVKPDPHIQWSYLRDNEWLAFAKQDVQDRTAELINSGVITFSVPRDATDGNSLLPAGMHWLRAAVASKSDSVCRLIMVAAQALEATFLDHGNDPAFPAKTLPAGTISKLDQPDADVKSISQPFPSFGGRGKEAPADFYTRISERLRHKDRAIALWDYEHLILQAFPQIYRAKCLNHTQYDPDSSGAVIYRELAPGHVTVVTIPDQQFRNLRDPLRPYTSLGLLEEIALFLSERLNCFVQLHVKNPLFEEVKVACKVILVKGYDESFYLKQLQGAVIRFLSPWAFPGGGSPTFGGKIYKSVLIDFIEDLPYVDCVTDFLMFHTFIDANGSQKTEQLDEVGGSKGVSILVSARKHEIAAIKPAETSSPGEKCRCQT